MDAQLHLYFNSISKTEIIVKEKSSYAYLEVKYIEPFIILYFET